MLGEDDCMTKQYPEEYYMFFDKFNEGEYYECHDLLEEIWLGDRENRFLQGLLQLSVGIYHYEYGNIKGARLMLTSALQYIQKYRPTYWGIDLEEVDSYLRQLLQRLPEVDRIPLEAAKANPLPKIVLSLKED